MTDYRADFDIPREVCYLNAAYMTPQPRSVIEAAIGGAAIRSRPWKIDSAHFFENVEALRSRFASLVGCHPDNIAIVPSAGYGMSCAAANTQVPPNSVVLGLMDQFPSAYYAWRQKVTASGAQFHLCRPAAGQSWTEAILQAVRSLGERISVATLEAHHWASAETIDLARVVPALRDVGARVVLDLTQTIGATPISISELEPDFMVAAGYKWQFCPYGVAFLYVQDRHFDGVSIEEPWMSREGAEDFSRLSEYTDRYQEGARRFDVSAKSSFSNISGALAALNQIADWDIENISASLAVTNQKLATLLEQHGFQTLAPETRAPHFQGAKFRGADPRSLAATLKAERVYASVRGDYIRVSPHLYTDDHDLSRFSEALRIATSGQRD